MRRRPANHEALGVFAAGYAGQRAEAQAAEFGHPAMQQGTIRVPAEAVRGMFAEGAFRPRAIRDETAHERGMADMLRRRQH